MRISTLFALECLHTHEKSAIMSVATTVPLAGACAAFLYRNVRKLLAAHPSRGFSGGGFCDSRPSLPSGRLLVGDAGRPFVGCIWMPSAIVATELSKLEAA